MIIMIIITIIIADRKGTNGAGTNGVTANFMFFDRDLLGTPVNLLLSHSTQCVRNHLHSAKGGAVETGCSDLYDVIY